MTLRSRINKLSERLACWPVCPSGRMRMPSKISWGLPFVIVSPTRSRHSCLLVGRRARTLVARRFACWRAGCGPGSPAQDRPRSYPDCSCFGPACAVPPWKAVSPPGSLLRLLVARCSSTPACRHDASRRPCMPLDSASMVGLVYACVVHELAIFALLFALSFRSTR